MKAISLISTTVLLASALSSSFAHASKLCPSPWLGAGSGQMDCRADLLNVVTTGVITGKEKIVQAQIRSGYLAENPQVPFRGNIIYYQGLGDSMLNHQPLFSKLTQAGYRVIAFDYMGQGGSTGDMNDTRIKQIATLGNTIWKLHARDLAQHPQKTIIGWSTGGLAAYVQAASDSEVSKVILLAPGIAPNLTVGEQHPLKLKFNQITLESLTSQVYSEGVENPHVDPIRPGSPLEVMNFSLNLTASARNSHSLTVDAVQGLVLLSGDGDTYVNASKTSRLLQHMAPHFKVKQYPGTLHELDNEAEPARSEVHQDILDFLNAN